MSVTSCPLCGTEATSEAFDFTHRHFIKCPSCSEFVITETALRRLAKAPQNWRDQLAAAAKAAPPDQVLEISAKVTGDGLELTTALVPRPQLGR